MKFIFTIAQLLGNKSEFQFSCHKKGNPGYLSNCYKSLT